MRAASKSSPPNFWNSKKLQYVKTEPLLKQQDAFMLQSEHLPKQREMMTLRTEALVQNLATQSDTLARHLEGLALLIQDLKSRQNGQV